MTEAQLLKMTPKNYIILESCMWMRTMGKTWQTSSNCENMWYYHGKRDRQHA